MSVPNQRIITVQKAKADKNHLYTTINLNSLQRACKCLKTIGGIKLFLYMAKNQNKYTFELSRASFMEWSGLAETAYRSGIAELIDKGYLVNTKGSFYVFHEDGGIADSEQENTKYKEERKTVDVFTF